MERDYSHAVLIGRFQPLHNSHVRLIERGLEIADKVILLVGSAHSARTPKNPFTFEERKSMILDTFHEVSRGQGHLSSDRVFVIPIRDYFYSDDVWLANVQNATSNYIDDGDTVALLGAYKDSSSYYLNLFPQWEYVATDGPTMDATKVREKLFDVGVFVRGWDDRQPKGVPVIKPEVLESQNKWFAKNLPAAVIAFIDRFRTTSEFGDLADEFYALKEYKKSWDRAPFPPTFVTADAVVTCAGHVLVVKRGFNPGKGTIALPGGFVREGERIRAAAIRELKEETRIRVEKIILDSSIVDSHVFDHPERSLRGRTITHAYHIKLKSGKLPEVKQGSDAKGAFWMPLADFHKKEAEVFEDHYHIVQYFISRN